MRTMACGHRPKYIHSSFMLLSLKPSSSSNWGVSPLQFLYHIYLYLYHYSSLDWLMCCIGKYKSLKLSLLSNWGLVLTCVLCRYQSIRLWVLSTRPTSDMWRQWAQTQLPYEDHSQLLLDVTHPFYYPCWGWGCLWDGYMGWETSMLVFTDRPSKFPSPRLAAPLCAAAAHKYHCFRFGNCMLNIFMRFSCSCATGQCKCSECKH